jgi:hypothetical protein
MELLARAIQAYYVECRRQGVIADQPNPSDSGMEIHSGKGYVVLRNSNGTLAVYRLRHGGTLKALKRWPPAVKIW